MGTYTQLYVQIVFGTFTGQKLLRADIRDNVFRYMTGVIKNRGHKPIIINGMADHVHILIGLNPDNCISDLVKEVKRSSTNFINARHLIPVKFSWQQGYGAFSYSRSHLSRVIEYIKRQAEHHKMKSFKSEYMELLDKFGIDYDPKWLD